MRKIKIFLLLFFAFILLPQSIQANSIGWVSDIHAGNDSLRNEGSTTGNIQEPKNYEGSFNSVLKELKNKSVNTVIVSGDMVNDGGAKYAGYLKNIAKNYGMNVLWTKGNHDGEDTLRELGFLNNRYYFRDFDNLRIIVLDNTTIYEDYFGGFSAEQIEWLRQALLTSQDVIISMHIPIFSGASQGHVLMDRYKEFESIVSSSGNVKMVLSGHYHENFETEINGVKYKILKPLTRKNENRTYGLVNLDDYSVSYLKAEAIKYKTVVKNKPRTIKVSKTKIKKGKIFTYSGKNFSKRSDIKLFITKSGSLQSAVINVKTDKKGKFYLSEKLLNKSPGKYSWYALDTKNNKKSKKSSFTVVK